MPTYAGRILICSICKQPKKCLVRTDKLKSYEVEEPVTCSDCKEAKVLFPLGTRCNLALRDGSKPTVSKISGFGKSFDDFDRDYDRMMGEGA
jgi:hypothetical protein